MEAFDQQNFISICDTLASRDADLRAIVKTYGHPPMWTRPGTFETLILTILEQQVSLASAYAAFKKLKSRIGRITPQNVLALTDAELRECYFSRQKITYARALATAVIEKKLNLRKLAGATNDEVRIELKKIKGIGDWTVDVYLMQALQRSDLFPLGDVALVRSLKDVKKLGLETTKEKLLEIAEAWRPYRTVAAMILWHAYIEKRGMKVAWYKR